MTKTVENSAHSLTNREIDVLRLLARGRSNKEIGKELDLTEGTIKDHVHHILHKLNLPNREQAMLWALRHGIINLHDEQT